MVQDTKERRRKKSMLEYTENYDVKTGSYRVDSTNNHCQDLDPLSGHTQMT